MSIKFLNGIDVDNGVLYTDTSNNRVGINTSSPQVPLEVKYTGTVDEIVRIVGTASGKPQVNFYNDTTLHTKIVAAGNNDFSITNTHSTGDMFFATGGATRLHIESSGLVGIGTNTPGYKLDVNGSIRSGGNYLGSGSAYTYLSIANGNYHHKFYTRTNTAAASERFTIEGGAGTTDAYFSNVNVGIGTTSPGAKLDVEGRVDFSNDLRLRGTDSSANQGVTRFYVDSSNKLLIDTANNGSNIFVIDSAGNVGIGNTSPTKELEIGTNAAAETELRMHSDVSGKYFNIQSAGNFTSVKTTGSQNFILDSSGSSGYVTVVTNASERMRVNYNGNVGIGTTSPSDKLEVYNNGGDVAIRIHEDAGTHEAKLHLRRGGSDWELINNNNFTIESEDSEKFRITTTGNVGIGTTNPGVKLHIGPGTASSSTVEEFRIQTGVSGGYGGTAVINLLTGQYGNSGIYFGDQATYSSQPAFIEFQDSPSTLIYKAPVTSGSHVFKIGTSEQVRIAYNGYVGIGMSNPGAKLHVGVSSGSSSTTQEFRLQTQSGGYGGEAIINLRTGQYGTSGVYFGDGLSHTAQPAYIKFIDSSNSLGLKTSGSFSFITNTSTAMYLQSSGLGVGETSPTARLQVKESSITSFTGTGSSAQLRLRGGYTNNEYIILGFSQDTNKDIGRMAVKRGSSGSSFHWGVSTNYGNGITNEAMVLTHQGYLGIKNLSPSYLLDVAGDGRVNGKLRCVTLIQTSQRDQKKDIADINKTKAKAIPFKEYKYKSSIDGSERKRYGVIAEDIENDYPELVHTGADGVKGINYIDLLVKRVAELEKELEDISLTPGPKGSTGATGPAGADGKNGANGNSHLSGVESIAFNEKTGQLEITIGKSTYRFNPAK